MNEWTYTNAEPDEGLTVDKLLKILEELNKIVPPLLYHTSKYAPRLNAEGEPLIAQMPAIEWAARPAEEPYILFHPDNLPAVQSKLAGRYRLVPKFMRQD